MPKKTPIWSVQAAIERPSEVRYLELAQLAGSFDMAPRMKLLEYNLVEESKGGGELGQICDRLLRDGVPRHEIVCHGI